MRSRLYSAMMVRMQLLRDVLTPEQRNMIVGIGEIAALLDVPVSVVSTWIKRREAEPGKVGNGFPDTVRVLRATKLYDWLEVLAWWQQYDPKGQQGRSRRAAQRA